MKIKELNQHCGNCGVTEYCGNPFGYCLCRDERFGEMDERDYCKSAEHAPTKCADVCEGCGGENCETCDNDDEARDFQCEQIADYVEKVVTGNDTKQRRD